MLKLLALLLFLGVIAVPITVGAVNWGHSPSHCKTSCQVQAPEIDAGSGLSALAVLLAGLALAYERRRRA